MGSPNRSTTQFPTTAAPVTVPSSWGALDGLAVLVNNGTAGNVTIELNRGGTVSFFVNQGMPVPCMAAGVVSVDAGVVLVRTW